MTGLHRFKGERMKEIRQSKSTTIKKKFTEKYVSFAVHDKKLYCKSYKYGSFRFDPIARYNYGLEWLRDDSNKKHDIPIEKVENLLLELNTLYHELNKGGIKWVDKIQPKRV